MGVGVAWLMSVARLVAQQVDAVGHECTFLSVLLPLQLMFWIKWMSDGLPDRVHDSNGVPIYVRMCAYVQMMSLLTKAAQLFDDHNTRCLTVW